MHFPVMKEYFKILLIAILLGCFFIQVRDGFTKFIKRQTTVVSTTKSLSTFRLPAISFCPGYKDHGKDVEGRFEEMNNVLEDDGDNRTPMDIWLNDTYDIGEILIDVKPPWAHYNSPQLRLNHSGFYPDLNITLHEISTVYGRCYAIHFSSYLLTNRDEYFTLSFNMLNHKEMVLFFHENYNEIGLHWGYYPIVPVQTILVANAHYAISVKEDHFTPYDNSGCNDENDYSYPKCVVHWTQRQYLQMFTETLRAACWVPDTQYYAINSNIKACLTKEEAEWARFNSFIQISHHLDDSKITRCARRCVRNDLKIINLRQPDYNDKSAQESDRTDIYYSGIFQTDEREEVRLYDLNNIVAAIGGSLGLLLGVSAYAIIVFLAQKCHGFIIPGRRFKHSTMTFYV